MHYVVMKMSVVVISLLCASYNVWCAGPKLASYPGSFGKGKKRAWLPLSAHAKNYPPDSTWTGCKFNKGWLSMTNVYYRLQYTDIIMSLALFARICVAYAKASEAALHWLGRR